MPTLTLSHKTQSLKRLSILLCIFLLVGQVNAAALFCRSDPVVILSNGMIMDFGANIATLPWNVQEVHYELHIPAGVSVVVAVHTPTWISSRESFTIHADQPDGQYIVKAIVGTHQSNVSVNLDATLVSLNLKNLHLGTYSKAGFEDQLLAIFLRP